MIKHAKIDHQIYHYPITINPQTNIAMSASRGNQASKSQRPSKLQRQPIGLASDLRKEIMGNKEGEKEE